MTKKIISAITIDTDWASDEIMKYSIDLLLKYRIKSTWFITNNSAQSRRLFCDKDLFEIGIHPNFLSNSTQGHTVEEVISGLLDICPDAKIMRTHSLYQSTCMFETILKKYPSIKIDVSLFLPYEKHISPHKYHTVFGSEKPYIVRIPYVWEDDYEMCLPKPSFKFNLKKFDGTGIKIFDFHPIHIALNSCDLDAYKALKLNIGKNISKLSLKDVLSFRQDKRPGVEDFLRELLSNRSLKFTHLSKEVGI